ncbi:hypothetical protein MBLNU457_5440t2 [Dothideomycetes sp. NU457]
MHAAEPQLEHKFDISKYNPKGPASIKHLLPGNALRWLGSTSVHLRSVVESYSASLLQLWADIVKIHPPPGNLHQTTSFVRAEYLLGWIHHACVFCGIPQVDRRAVFANNLACCSDCDHDEWRDRIGQTEAKKTYNLTDAHLFDYVNRPTHWPVLRFGPDYKNHSITIFFLREDLERLADAVHGDWKSHVNERKRKAAQRKEKMIQNKRKHIESGNCPGVDGCRYCIDVREADQDAGARSRTATRRRIEYSEIPDDDEDREIWIDGMRRTAAEDPNWEAPVMV